jgi:hypothetical protein
MRQRKALQMLLTVNTALLGLLVADRLFGGVADLIPGPAQAHAYGPAPAPDEPNTGGMISAAEQRKTIIAELQNLARKLDRVDAAVRGTVNVKVTEMPKPKNDDGK